MSNLTLSKTLHRYEEKNKRLAKRNDMLLHENIKLQKQLEAEREYFLIMEMALTIAERTNADWEDFHWCKKNCPSKKKLYEAQQFLFKRQDILDSALIPENIKADLQKLKNIMGVLPKFTKENYDELFTKKEKQVTSCSESGEKEKTK